MSISASVLNYDLKKTVVANRLLGLWRMMSGFRWHYAGATLSLGIAALAKTSTYLLLSYFVDQYFNQGPKAYPLPLIAFGFVALAMIEGGASFMSGRLTAQTAEGATRRLRNYLFDHIQHLSFTYHSQTQTGELIQRCTSDVDAVRRFFADQAIGVGRIILLFTINFVAIMNLIPKLGLVSVVSLLLSILLGAFSANLAIGPLTSISKELDRIASGGQNRDEKEALGKTRELAIVQSKLNLLGQQIRGAQEDATHMRSNIESLMARMDDAVLLFDKSDQLIMAGAGAGRAGGRCST